MSGPTGWDLLTEQIVDYVRAEVEANMSSATGDSEIERLFHHALCSAATFRQVQHDHISEIKTQEDRSRLKDGSLTLFYERQAQLEWRVDFLFSCWNHGYGGSKREWKYLIVECDGHNFHERDKLQAARDRSRDRWAAQNKYTIYRFTGSEIWRDPLGCALQVFDWASEFWP